MSTAKPLWSFTDRVEPRRREVMLAVPDWATASRVVQANLPRWMGFEIRQDPLGVGGAGAKRASVRIAMSSDDADIFYNSPVGLRAQYCLGAGATCNRDLIHSLVPACLAKVDDAERTLAEQSLRGSDAKLCVDKNDIPIIQEVHISYDPWIAALGSGDRFAETGVIAPRVEAIWIKGGWVLDGTEWRDPVKANRSEKFRQYGFS